MTRSQISDLNGQIEDELAKVKERLAELQDKKNAAKQIYDGACKMLGVENDLEKEGKRPEAERGLVPKRACAAPPHRRRRAASLKASRSSAGLQGDHLPQAGGREPIGVPQVLLPLPASARERLELLFDGSLGGVRPRPGERGPARVRRHQALHQPPQGRARKTDSATPW